MCLTRMWLLLSVILLIFVSCSSKSNVADSPGTDSISSMEDVPQFEEFSNLPMSERLRIKMEIENIPITSCDAYYESLIQDFLQEKELVSLRQVTVERDDLSLIPGKNKKSLLNLNLHIDLEMDTTKSFDSWDIAKEVTDQIIKYMRSDTFYALKVKRCIVSTYDVTGFLVTTAERIGSVTNESIFREQSEAEYAAQSIAYDYSVKNSEFVLEKFGALSETKELYIEYYVEDSYFGLGEDENKRCIDNLENIANNIKDYLVETSAVDNYITENGSKILTISFRNGILEDFYLVFNYKL